MEPLFLELEEVLEIHRDQLQRYGGKAGVRDMRLLQSALAAPSAGSGDQYFHSDLFEMAAAYLFHIVKNHPFIDGNKRVGLASSLIFLWLNGVTVDATDGAFVRLTLRVAEGELSKSGVAEFFRKHART